jgi:hypothetical protein
MGIAVIVSTTASASLIWYDSKGFEAFSLGDLNGQKGWTGNSSGSGLPPKIEMSLNGTKAVRLEVSAAQNDSSSMRLANLGDIIAAGNTEVTLTMDIYRTKSGATWKHNLWFNFDGTGSHRSGMQWDNQNGYYLPRTIPFYDEGGNTVSTVLGSYATLKIFWDLNNNKVSAWYNNALVVNGKTVTNPITSLTNWSAVLVNDAGKSFDYLWIDNFKIEVDKVGLTPVPGTMVYHMTPAQAANKGPVTFTIYGHAFTEGATAELQMTGKNPIAGTDISFQDGNAQDGYETMTATFTLEGCDPGTWDIKITNPDKSWAAGEKKLIIYKELLLQGVYPPNGANIGYRTVYLLGEGFTSNMKVKLTKDGQPDIPAVGINVVGPKEAEVLFKLHRKETGEWSMIAWEGDDISSASTLSYPFTILPLESLPKVTVNVGGPTIVRSGRVATYSVSFISQGLLNAVGVPIISGIPKGATWQILSTPKPLLPIPADRPERGKRFVFTRDEEPKTLNLLFPMIQVPAGFPVIIRLSVLPPEDIEEWSIKASWDQFQP